MGRVCCFSLSSLSIQNIFILLLDALQLITAQRPNSIVARCSIASLSLKLLLLSQSLSCLHRHQLTGIECTVVVVVVGSPLTAPAAAATAAAAGRFAVVADRRFAVVEPVGLHHALAFQADRPSLSDVPLVVVQQPLRVLADLHAHLQTGRLHATGGVHGVAKEAVPKWKDENYLANTLFPPSLSLHSPSPWHLLADNAAHHGAGVNADANLEMPSARGVLDMVHRLDHVHRHQADLPGVTVAALLLMHWQTARHKVRVADCLHLQMSGKRKMSNCCCWALHFHTL